MSREEFYEKYLGFDDRLFTLIGIPLLTFILPFLFFGMTWSDFKEVFPYDFLESLLFTSSFWILCRFLILFFRKRYPNPKDNLRRIIYQVVSISLAIIPIEISIHLMCDYLNRAFFEMDTFEPTPLQGAIATYFVSFTIATLYEAIFYFKKYNEAVLEKERIQRSHIQGQLDNLRNQINPHFLFNSMNTLMNLIPTDQNRAMNYLSKLSKFYRYTVSKQEATLIDLASELDNCKIYAELLLERFPKGISFQFPEEIPSDAKILPLCMQILVENAVKHNIVSSKKPLKVQVRTQENGTYLEVCNNLQPKIQEVASTGMGLNNLRQRIAFFTDQPIIVKEERDTFSVAVPLIHSNHNS